MTFQPLSQRNTERGKPGDLEKEFLKAVKKSRPRFNNLFIADFTRNNFRLNA